MEGEKRKRGRPKKNKNKNKMVCVRVDDDLYYKMKQSIELEGNTQTDFLTNAIELQCLVTKNTKTKEEIEVYPDENYMDMEYEDEDFEEDFDD